MPVLARLAAPLTLSLLRVDPADLETGGATLTVTPAWARRSPPAPLTAAGGWGAPPGRRVRPAGGRWGGWRGAGGG
jgi:hypothetical protein